MIGRREFIVIGGGAVFSAAALRATGTKGKTVLVGATAKACGMALARPDDTLILERGIHPAPDFLLSLDPENAGVPRSSAGKAFAETLRSNGALGKDGRLYHQPATYILSKFLAEHGVNVLYSAEYVGCRANGGGVDVTATGNDGPETFSAGRVISMERGRTLAITGVLAKKGASLETRLFRVPLPPDADWTKARLLLHSAWTRRRIAYPGYELAAEAGAIKRETGFPNFFSAFEEGLSWTGM